MRRTRPLLAAVLALALVAGCSDDSDSSSVASSTTTVAETTTTEAPVEALRILVGNDDGITHPGIDLLARALSEMPDVEVTVVAPATNKTGSSDKTTPGGAPHRAGATTSGIEGTVVEGFPADAIAVALEELGLEPHLVVSGINDIQNIGPFAAASGTVGVARTAIRRGIPAVAVSAGEFDEAQFEAAAGFAIDWITEHRDALVDRTQPADHVISFNIPKCRPEQMGELVEVPLATGFPEGANPLLSTCDLADPAPATDYAAIASGYPALTRVPAEL